MAPSCHITTNFTANACRFSLAAGRSFSGPGCGFHVMSKSGRRAFRAHFSEDCHWRDIHKTVIAKRPSHITRKLHAQVGPRQLAQLRREYPVLRCRELCCSLPYLQHFEQISTTTMNLYGDVVNDEMSQPHAKLMKTWQREWDSKPRANVVLTTYRSVDGDFNDISTWKGGTNGL